MADFPLAVNLQGDYGYKVIVVDDGDSIADVIQKAADQIVGILVAPFPPDTLLQARIHGSDDPLPPAATVKEAKLISMEAIDIYAGG